MKKNLLFCISLLLFVTGKAQNKNTFPHINPETDKMELSGYRINLIPGFNNSYGYEIKKGPVLIVRQTDNPITPAISGFFTKQNAFDMAQWTIKELISRGSVPKVYPDSLITNLNIIIFPKNLKSNQ